ncbi:MAG: type II secretion system F family protein [Actinomycetota bacterium]
MTDLWVVLASFTAVAGLLVGQRRLRDSQDAGRLVSRLDQPAVRPIRPAGRKPLLEQQAGRFASTPLGARIAARTGRDHPGVAFSDALAFGLAAMIGGGILGAVFFGSPVAALILGAGSPVALDLIFKRLHGNRTARLEKQLPAALSLQAASLRAGQSLSMSLRVVQEGSKAPLAEELAGLLNHVDLGVPIEQCLEQLAARSGSGDVGLWVNSMLIHRQTGGNLAHVIDSMALRVGQRLQLRSEIKALTAQGRMSGTVVAASPIAFFLFLSLGSRDQVDMLYTTPMGWVLLITGLTLNALGLLWIRAILRIHP